MAELERVIIRSDKFTETDYRKYLTDLNISTEFFRGTCPGCGEVFKIKPLPFEYVDDSFKFPAITCPYCGNQEYYHNIFINDIPELIMDTTLTCLCGLTYSFTGVTVICPKCWVFNSREIYFIELHKISSKIKSSNDRDNLSDCLSKFVSLFDGYGRATIRFPFFTKTIPNDIKAISFQNLEGANRNIEKAYHLTIKDLVSPGEWNLLYTYFQRRHLFSHNLGVTDQDYLNKTADSTLKVGQKIPLDAEELLLVIETSKKLARNIYSFIAS